MRLNGIDSIMTERISSTKNDFNDGLSSVFMLFGDKYFMGSVFAGSYITSIITDNSELRKVSLLTIKSAVISTAVTYSLKLLIHRHRPNETEDPYVTDGISFDFEHLSFPSGHTTLAFSLSSVLAAHVDEWYWKALIFTPAVLTAAQRVIYDRHWFSDVFLGASIGYFVGTFLVNRHEDLMNTRFAFYIDPYGRIGLTYLLK